MLDVPNYFYDISSVALILLLIIHPIKPRIFPPAMRSQPPLETYFSMGPLEGWMHVGHAGFYTAVDESSKYDSKARIGGWQQELCDMESWEGNVLFCTYRGGHHCFYYGLRKRAAVAGELCIRGEECWGLLPTRPIKLTWFELNVGHRWPQWPHTDKGIGCKQLYR